MTTRSLALTLVIALSLDAHRTDAQTAPNHQDFRPQTFTRPTSTLGGFHDRGGSYRPYVIVVPTAPTSGYGGYSSYYDSVAGNYGASPFDGLDASRALYSQPVRRLIYAPAAGVPRIGFYESTMPYGDYRLRSRWPSR